MAGKMRLLIAEDDELVLLGLKLVVEQLGHQVYATARTAEEAVDIAECTLPDLALIDVGLADGSDGLFATREISGRLEIPVIVCSAHATEEQALEAGARRFLMKPFGIEVLAEAIRAIRGPDIAGVTLAA
jgi:DNA-binding NarL/FixJ family response regulator